MKLPSKKTRWMLVILLTILCPIIFHQVVNFKAAIAMQKAAGIPVTVQVSEPIEKEIYSETESSGRIEAIESVDVLARINGWIKKIYFKEGSKVKKGQSIILIEPDEYQLSVNNAAAIVRQNQAVYVNADKDLTRAAELVKQDYVSKSYYDDALSARDRALAALDSAKAQLANAKLNLSYTNITSPVDGKIGKILITEGNLVNPSAGALAKIVSVSPIHVYFTLKSGEYLQLRKNIGDADFSNTEVSLKLADGSIYGENGEIQFVNNEVDRTTGTMTIRATFKNEDELLVPGDFVTVTVKSKEPKRVVLLPQVSVLDDANGYYVWVLDEENKVVRRDIKVGSEIDKNWIVEEGIQPGEKYVAKGIQSIRMPGQKVNPEPLDEAKQ